MMKFVSETQKPVTSQTLKVVSDTERERERDVRLYEGPHFVGGWSLKKKKSRTLRKSELIMKSRSDQFYYVSNVGNLGNPNGSLRWYLRCPTVRHFIFTLFAWNVIHWSQLLMIKGLSIYDISLTLAILILINLFV